MTKIGDVQDALSTCREQLNHLDNSLNFQAEELQRLEAKLAKRAYLCNLLVHTQDRFDCGLMGVHEYMNAIANIAKDAKEYA